MNTTTTSESQQSEFIEALNQTEVGAFLAQHLKLIVSLVVLVAVALIGWGVYSYQMDQKRLAASEVMFKFKQQTLAPLKAGELSVEKGLENFQEAYNKTTATLVGFPTLIDLADEFSARGELEAALSTLDMAPDMSGMPYAQYFLATRKAVVLEDLGQNQQALHVLEKLRDSTAQLLSDKVYLDLGRLYKASGDIDKARVSFQHVLDNMAQNEFATLARLHLNELNAQAKD